MVSGAWYWQALPIDRSTSHGPLAPRELSPPLHINILRTDLDHIRVLGQLYCLKVFNEAFLLNVTQACVFLYSQDDRGISEFFLYSCMS